MGKEERAEWLDYLENQAEYIWNNTIHEVGRLSTKSGFSLKEEGNARTIIDGLARTEGDGYSARFVLS